jgi:hypothetical protein
VLHLNAPPPLSSLTPWPLNLQVSSLMLEQMMPFILWISWPFKTLSSTLEHLTPLVGVLSPFWLINTWPSMNFLANHFDFLNYLLKPSSLPSNSLTLDHHVSFPWVCNALPLVLFLLTFWQTLKHTPHVPFSSSWTCAFHEASSSRTCFM